uniref:Protein kinase domain-containing protein n=1 Tax=Eutreptiella gymnastica TaxID=73025 RepID=A0A7S4CXA6_9EUGL
MKDASSPFHANNVPAFPRTDSPLSIGAMPPEDVPTGGLEAQLQESLMKEKNEKERLQTMLRNQQLEIESLVGKMKKMQDLLVERVRQSCAAEKEQERKAMHEKFYELGQVVVQRDMSELWHDGPKIRELKARLEKVREEMEQIKKSSQERKNKEKKKGKQGTEDDDCGDDLQLLQKKEEAVLLAEIDSLDAQKHLFIKDIKRIRNEDSSRFNACPILNERYLLERLLGRGGFSEVYKAYDLVESRIVACKIHQLNSAWSDERKHSYIKHARREYEIHKTLNHPRVIQLYDVFDIDQHTFATILEYCDGIDLDIFLKKNKFMTEKDSKAMIYQVFCGLKYLNERPEPIIHFDLKPGNILLTRNMGVKITDFGLSKIMPSQDETHIDLTSQGAGTYWYLPPECFQTGCIPKISAKVDVWGAAVVFYQMLYGRKPFGNDVSQQQLVQNRIILNARSVEFPAKPQVSPETKDFIRKLLCYNQEERPDIFTICADPYFSPKSAPKRKSSVKDTA